MSPPINIDGNSISSITIDGETVKEVTIDGQVAYQAAYLNRPRLIHQMNDMSGWTVNSFGPESSFGDPFSGTPAFFSSDLNQEVAGEVTPFPNGRKIGGIKYWRKDRFEFSSGSGVRLLNSNGNREGVTAVDNGNYDVIFGNTSGKVAGGGNTETWFPVVWNFNWHNNSVTVSVGGNYSHTNTYSLINGKDISTVQLVSWDGSSVSGSNMYSFWDNVQIRTYQSNFGNGEINTPKWDTNGYFPDVYSSYNNAIDATLHPYEEPQYIEKFAFEWFEDLDQSGFVARLRDKNNNKILEHGSENPSWYLNTGDGGRTQITGQSPPDYKDWVTAVFELDWANNQYQYNITQNDFSRSGTQPFSTSNPVDNLRFSGDGYGSADDMQVKNIKLY